MTTNQPENTEKNFYRRVFLSVFVFFVLIFLVFLTPLLEEQFTKPRYKLGFYLICPIIVLILLPFFSATHKIGSKLQRSGFGFFRVFFFALLFSIVGFWIAGVLIFVESEVVLSEAIWRMDHTGHAARSALLLWIGPILLIWGHRFVPLEKVNPQ